MSNRRPPARRRINGTAPRPPRLVVPHFTGVDTSEWSDLPPAAYPLAVIDDVIRPRLEAGDDLIRLNGYLCTTCKGITLTVDQHPGVTPAYVDHRRFDPDTRCDGMAASLNYDPDLRQLAGVPSHQWYRPSERELLDLGRSSDAVVNHVLNGGLLLRPIPLVELKVVREGDR